MILCTFFCFLNCQYSKSLKFFCLIFKQNLDLYADFVAPTLMSALAVETWQHGAKDGNLGPFCKSNHHRVSNFLEKIAMGIAISNSIAHGIFIN